MTERRCVDCDRCFTNAKAYAGHRARKHAGEPAICGTANAYNRGCRCLECSAAKYQVIVAWRRAHPTYNAERQRAKRARAAALRAPVEPPQCGTAAAWHRHYRAGERPCAACVEAVNDYNRAKAAARRRRRRRGATWRVVADFLDARGPITSGALFDLIWQRHPDIARETMRDALTKLRRAQIAAFDVDEHWRIVADWTELTSLR